MYTKNGGKLLLLANPEKCLDFSGGNELESDASLEASESIRAFVLTSPRVPVMEARSFK